MRIRTIQLLALLCVTSFASCSNDGPLDVPQALIIGEWEFISENHYRCGTEDVVLDMTQTDSGIILTFKAQDNKYFTTMNGEVIEDPGRSGKWKHITGTEFELSYIPHGETEPLFMKVLIEEDQLQKDFTACFLDEENKLWYSFELWEKN